MAITFETIWKFPRCVIYKKIICITGEKRIQIDSTFQCRKQLLLHYILGLGRAEARPNIWPAGLGFWVAQLGPDLRSPTQPECQKKWKIGWKSAARTGPWPEITSLTQSEPKTKWPDPTRARKKVARPSPIFCRDPEYQTCIKINDQMCGNCNFVGLHSGYIFAHTYIIIVVQQLQKCMKIGHFRYNF